MLKKSVWELNVVNWQKRCMLLGIVLVMLVIPTGIVNAEECSPEIALPSGLVTMVAEDGVNSWFSLNLSNVPAGYDITNGSYFGWCLQPDKQMSREINHSVYLFSSYDQNVPEEFISENWSKINYILNNKNGRSLRSIQHALWYYIDSYQYPTDPVAQTIIAEAEEHGAFFCPGVGDILAIAIDVATNPPAETQRACLEFIVPPQSTGGPPGGTPPRNHPPTADGTAGEPYVGIVGQPIVFDGSRSYDRDGFILSWWWDFGDMTFGDQKIMSHVYTAPGVYPVTLTVIDNQGALDTYRTQAMVVIDNLPPSAPLVNGTFVGTQQTQYEYTAVSTDPENHTIRYIFNWGDGSNETVTNLTDSGALVNTSHLWSAAGVYRMTVSAQDILNATSPPTQVLVCIDVTVEFLSGELSGYLIDYEHTGTFTMFYNNGTGLESAVELQQDGTYLLDSTGEGVWDYRYDPFTGLLSQLEPSPEKKTPGFELLLVLGAFMFVLFVRRRKKP